MFVFVFFIYLINNLVLYNEGFKIFILEGMDIWRYFCWLCGRWSIRLHRVIRNVMEEPWETTRLQWGYNASLRGIRVLIPYCLYEPRKGRKSIKGKARRAWDHLTTSIVHMPLWMCICLCNLISSPINIQYVVDTIRVYIPCESLHTYA